MQSQIVHSGSVRFCKSLPDGCIDLTVTSPPYDAVRDYNGKPALNLSRLGRQLLRVTRDGGICAMVIQDQTADFAKSLTTFRTAVQWCDLGWRLFECCVYQRDGRPGAWWSKRFRVDHEYILLFLKGSRPRCFDKSMLTVPCKHPNVVWHGTNRKTNGNMVAIGPKAVNKTKCRGTVWKYATSNTERNPAKMEHPATMPDLLARDLIRCFSREGDLVLDPCCGSGTTCVMAAQFGRRYVGVDISGKYCKLARRRIREETGE